MRREKIRRPIRVGRWIAVGLASGAGCLPAAADGIVDPTEQIPIERIEILPSLPDDYGTRDWKKVGRDLDRLVYQPDLAGGTYLRKNKFDGEGVEVSLFPIVFFDKTRTDHPERVHFGIPTFLRDQVKQKGNHYEAVTVLPSLIGATLLGIDKSNQDGVNWVSGALDFYHNASGQQVYLNNPGPDGAGGDSFWYAVYPNVLFSKLYALYKDQVDFGDQFTAVADTFYKLTDQLDGRLDDELGIPWGYTQYQGWDFKNWKPNYVNRSEAEGSCGAAYVLYTAYRETGNQKYLQATSSIMDLLSHPDAKNPTYELLSGFGVITMARMNAEEGRDYNLDRMLNWVFAEHSDYRPNWGMIAGGEKWHGYNMDGLIGSTVDRGGYGFLCNTCAYLVSVLPVAKYDERYARTLGKWAVNAASALRYFYRYDEKVFPGKNQYMADWLDAHDPDGCLAHDGVIKNDPEFPERLPHVCSETHNHNGWWSYDSDVSMYSSCHIGEVAAMMDTATGVEGIIQWDLNVTDYYHQGSYPTYLYYNPHPEPRRITLDVGGSPVDLYDTVSNQVVARGVQGETGVDLPGDAARVMVLLPAGSLLEEKGNILVVDGKVVDYHHGRENRYAQGRDIDTCVRVLQDALQERSIQDLAGATRHMMGSAKNGELMAAARSGQLTVEVVAAYAQSVHKAVLRSIENELDVPPGFFRAAMRQVQFGEDYGFIGEMPDSLGQQKILQREIRDTFREWLKIYKDRGGKAMPLFPMQLSGMAQGRSPANDREAYRLLQELTESIPGWELKKRHAYITKLPKSDVPGLSVDVDALQNQPLVNMDHLLKVLGSIREGKLLVSVYGENVPTGGAAIAYQPIHALGEGAYCVDDIARVVVALAHEIKQPEKAPFQEALVAGAEYLLAMQAEDGEFYNFASLEEGAFAINKTGISSKKGIGFWSTRAMWGLASAYGPLSQSDPALAARIKAALDKTIPLHEAPMERYGQYREVDGLKLPMWLLNHAGDQTAILLNGLITYYQALPPGGDRDRVRVLVEKYTDGLIAAQVRDPASPERGRFLHSTESPGARHLWGSQQMEVVARAGKVLDHPAYIDAARRCADHYWREKEYADLAGDHGAEIAYGINSVVSGFTALYRTTGESRYADEAERWASWLMGNNGARAVMYDPFSGRGYDGIDPVQITGGTRYTVSANSGAESTVEAVLALQAVEHIPGAHERLKKWIIDLLPQ